MQTRRQTLLSNESPSHETSDKNNKTPQETSLKRRLSTSTADETRSSISISAPSDIDRAPRDFDARLYSSLTDRPDLYPDIDALRESSRQVRGIKARVEWDLKHIEVRIAELVKERKLSEPVINAFEKAALRRSAQDDD